MTVTWIAPTLAPVLLLLQLVHRIFESEKFPFAARLTSKTAPLPLVRVMDEKLVLLNVREDVWFVEYTISGALFIVTVLTVVLVQESVPDPT